MRIGKIIRVLLVGLCILVLLVGLYILVYTIAGPKSKDFNKKATLTFLRSGGSAEEEIVGPIVKECTKNIGINVDLVMVPWGQTYNKIMTMITGGNAPDIAYIGSRWIPKLAKIGAIVPLNIPDKRKKEYFESIWPMVTYNGEIYGIPRAFSSKVLYYNTDLFAKVGISAPPQTWNELLAAARAISEKTSAYGFALAGEKFVSTTSQFFNFLFQNGGSVFDEKGNVALNNEKGIEALTFYKKLAKYAEEGSTAWKREELWELFAEGKVGMYVSGPWRVAGFQDKVPFAIAPLPAGPKGKSATILVSDSLVVFRQSKNQKAAVELALQLTSLENQKVLDTEWGMTPMREAETELDFFQQDKWENFIKMVPNGKPQPMVSDWETLEDAITDMIQFVLLDKMEPKEALDWAAAKLEALK